MAITTKFLEELGIEKDVADKIFAARGEEVEREKAKLATMKSELDAKIEAFNALTTEFETLKTADADGAEWKAKFEALKADNEAKAKQAEAERMLREKAKAISVRFDAAVGEKEFGHDAIRESYLKKFESAIEDAKYQGKSDADILHELTKDDARAFHGVEIIKLAGGAPSTGSGEITRDEFKKMSYKSRLKLYNDNPKLYEELNEKGD